MFIDWTHAKANAENMYNNEKYKNYVGSGLITGTQWDVMLKKMLGKTIGETTGKSEIKLTELNLTNSATFGNYMDTSIQYTGRLAIADKGKTNSGYWTLKPFGIKTTGTTTKYSSNNGDLLTTGASKISQVYHIYDIAGNLWEWTEENSLYSTSDQYRVGRGGSYYDSSSISACYRNYYPLDYTGLGVGFRTVLYIK